MRKLLVVASLLLAGCSSLNPIIDYDASVDFSRFRTFSWIAERTVIVASGRPPANPMIERHLKEATRATLEDKGFAFVEPSDRPDFVVAFTIGSREGVRVTSYPSHSMARGRAWSPHWGGAHVLTHRYTEGQLAIDILEVALARPIWHGTAERAITTGDRENMSETVSEFVKAILAKFPPK